MSLTYAVCNQKAREVRFVPTGYLPDLDSGWCCTDCWTEHWHPHWPQWHTLIDSERVLQARQQLKLL